MSNTNEHRLGRRVFDDAAGIEDVEVLERARGTSDRHVVEVPLNLLKFVVVIDSEANSLRDL